MGANTTYKSLPWHVPKVMRCITGEAGIAFACAATVNPALAGSFSQALEQESSPRRSPTVPAKRKAGFRFRKAVLDELKAMAKGEHNPASPHLLGFGLNARYFPGRAAMNRATWLRRLPRALLSGPSASRALSRG
jgi:hypothetical protein